MLTKSAPMSLHAVQASIHVLRILTVCVLTYKQTLNIVNTRAASIQVLRTLIVCVLSYEQVMGSVDTRARCLYPIYSVTNQYWALSIPVLHP